MGRRRKFAVGAMVVAAGGSAAATAIWATRDPSTAAADDDQAAAPATAEVSRRDLARTEELDGTIDFGGSRSLVLGATGVLTWLPSDGSVIGNGDRVIEVDGRPVVALVGSFPFWRTMNNDMDDGKDVLQLEYMLASMGYTDEHDVVVDDEFTWATGEALEDFQEEHGLDDDGELAPGEVVVISAPVRIDEVTGLLGQDAAAAGITVTRPTRTVEINVPVADADHLRKGTVVDVELPDGRVVEGTVTRIGAASTDAEGTTTLPASLRIKGVDDVADGTPVEVRVVVEEANDVLNVPVEAVLALAEGGYAVEVPNSAGTSTRLVPVELGMFADGSVEIEGDIEAGAKVVVP